jgi:hypothetical protein
MTKVYPPSGRLFKSKSTHPKAPDMDGKLEISQEVLDELNRQAKLGAKLEMDISAYENTHPNYGVWYRLIAKKPFVKKPQTGEQQRAKRNDDDELPF